MRLKEKEFFNKISNVFDNQFNVYHKLAGKLRIKERICFFLDFCKLDSGKSVLEIGCGTGEYTLRLAETDAKIFCVDISYEMIKLAKEKTKNCPDVFYVVSEVERLPFRQEAFDAVVGNSILHHLDLEKALSQIKFVLKQNGKFSFSEPNMLNPHIFCQKNIPFLKKLSGDSPKETAFLRWKLKKILANSGFSGIVIEPRDFLYPFLPDAFIKFIDKMSKIFEKAWFIKELAGSLFIRGMK